MGVVKSHMKVGAMSHPIAAISTVIAIVHPHPGRASIGVREVVRGHQLQRVEDSTYSRYNPKYKIRHNTTYNIQHDHMKNINGGQWTDVTKELTLTSP